MPARGLARPLAAATSDAWHDRTWLWVPLAVFGLTRAWGALAMMLTSRGQGPLVAPGTPEYYVHTSTPADPGYLAVIANWDGQWYQRLAEQGYGAAAGGWPESTASGFPPGFPMLVRALMRVGGLDFAVAVTAADLVLGALAAVLMFRLVAESAGRFAATAAVTLTFTFFTAPLFQAAYSESLALFLVCLTLLTIRRRRYLLATVVILALALTRVVTPPLAAVVAAHLLSRVRLEGSRSVPAWHWTTAGAAGAAAVLGVPLFSAVSARLAGEAGAGARRDYGGALADRGLGWFSDAYHGLGWLGVAMMLVLAGALVRITFLPPSRRWGTEVRTWFWAYPVFLMAAVPVHFGFFRYLLLAFPLGLVPVGSPGEGVPKGRTVLVAALAVAGLAGQLVWSSQVFVGGASRGRWLP